MQPTPVFLPGESQGQGSLVGCCLWGRTESDTTEATQQQQQQHRRYEINDFVTVAKKTIKIDQVINNIFERENKDQCQYYGSNV